MVRHQIQKSVTFVCKDGLRTLSMCTYSPHPSFFYPDSMYNLHPERLNSTKDFVMGVCVYVCVCVRFDNRLSWDSPGTWWSDLGQQIVESVRYYCLGLTFDVNTPRVIKGKVNEVEIIFRKKSLVNYGSQKRRTPS